MPTIINGCTQLDSEYFGINENATSPKMPQASTFEIKVPKGKVCDVYFIEIILTAYRIKLPNPPPRKMYNAFMLFSLL
jgi:hypothetical protein